MLKAPDTVSYDDLHKALKAKVRQSSWSSSDTMDLMSMLVIKHKNAQDEADRPLQAKSMPGSHSQDPDCSNW